MEEGFSENHEFHWHIQTPLRFDWPLFFQTFNVQNRFWFRKVYNGDFDNWIFYYWWDLLWQGSKQRCITSDSGCPNFSIFIFISSHWLFILEKYDRRKEESLLRVEQPTEEGVDWRQLLCNHCLLYLSVQMAVYYIV